MKRYVVNGDLTPKNDDPQHLGKLVVILEADAVRLEATVKAKDERIKELLVGLEKYSKRYSRKLGEWICYSCGLELTGQEEKCFNRDCKLVKLMEGTDGKEW